MRVFNWIHSVVSGIKLRLLIGRRSQRKRLFRRQRSFRSITLCCAAVLVASNGYADELAFVGPTMVHSGSDTGPRSVASGDFNGDGISDLVTANTYSGTPFGDFGEYTYDIAVLLGVGDGTFETPQLYAQGVDSRPTAADVADINGDGMSDVVIATSRQFEYGGITVMLGSENGDLEFADSVSTLDADFAVSITTGDFNSDGIPDVAASLRQDFGSSKFVLVGLLDASGNFTESFTLDVSDIEPGSIASADFNQDGLVDLVVTNRNLDTFTVLLNQGNGNFASGESHYVSDGPRSVVAADFNNDLIPDLAIANSPVGVGEGVVAVLFGEGDGTFAEPVSYLAGIQPQSITTGDFDADGILDLAAGDYWLGQAAILLGDSNGTFALEASFSAGSIPISISSGDFDGNGLPDLATVGGLQANGDIRVLINASNGEVLAGDVNLDGNINLLDVSPFVSLLSSGGYQAEADINCDGSVDLLDVAPFVDLIVGD